MFSTLRKQIRWRAHSLLAVEGVLGAIGDGMSRKGGIGTAGSECGEQIDPACCGVAVGSPSPGCAERSAVQKHPASPQLPEYAIACGEEQRYWKDKNRTDARSASGRIVLRFLKAAKGDGVHVLKGHVSWVQNGVSQFGLYLLEVLLPEGKER